MLQIWYCPKDQEQVHIARIPTEQAKKNWRGLIKCPPGMRYTLFLTIEQASNISVELADGLSKNRKQVKAMIAAEVIAIWRGGQSKKKKDGKPPVIWVSTQKERKVPATGRKTERN